MMTGDAGTYQGGWLLMEKMYIAEIEREVEGDIFPGFGGSMFCKAQNRKL